MLRRSAIIGGLLAVALGVVVAVWPDDGSDRDLEARIVSGLLAAEGQPFAIRTVTPFAWDRLVIVSPYAHVAAIEKRVGFPWPDAERVDLAHDEGSCLLVFVHRDQVVRYIKMARYPVDFAPRSPAEADYAPDNATFRTLRSDDWVYAIPVAVPENTLGGPSGGVVPMGIVTDFFAATPADFKRVLRGWQLPPPLLPEPIEVRAIDPFTGQPITLRTRVNRDAMPEPDPDAVPSPDISSLSVVRAKAFLPERLALVLSTLTNAPPEGALEQITGGFTVGPPNASITVTRLPDELTAALASADSGALHAVARVLAEKDARTLGTTPDDGVAGYAAILAEVAELARIGRSKGAPLFTWMAP